MDVVYILGTGSVWNNNELRLSLRSLERHVTGIGKVYVIGERPEFLQNAEYIYHPDPHACKERNIMEKVYRACEIDELSEDFMFMNDDIFILKDFEARKLANYYSGELVFPVPRSYQRDPYYKALQNTVKVLKEAGKQTRHFDIHVPIVYNKQKFREVMDQYDWDVEGGYVVKSLYANTLDLPGQPMKDLKINAPLATTSRIMNLIRNRLCFSIGNRGLNNIMRNVLSKGYSTKSKYEN